MIALKSRWIGLVVMLVGGVGVAQPNLLLRFDEDLVALSGRVRSGVVRIVTEKTYQLHQGDAGKRLGISRGRPRIKRGCGSGFIIERGALVLTTANVVRDATRIDVQYWDGTESVAKCIGMDDGTNIALLGVEQCKNEGLVLGDSDRLRVGSLIVAAGNPYGLPGSLNLGIVSGEHRRGLGLCAVEDLIQLNIPVNPGDSGGPVIDMHGEVIGIIMASLESAGVFEADVTRPAAQGIAFAVPVNTVKVVLPDLKRGVAPSRGWLGIAIQPLNPDLQEIFGVPDRRGALVAKIVDGGPADRAGLMVGDVIRAINGKPVFIPADLVAAVAGAQIGKPVELALFSNGKLKKKVIVVEERQNIVKGNVMSGRVPGRFGLVLEEVPAAGLGNKKAGKGLLVVGILPGSAASSAGIKRGDIILEAAKVPVNSCADWERAVKNRKPGERLLLRTPRGYFVIRGE
jgi:serine protease Do